MGQSAPGQLSPRCRGHVDVSRVLPASLQWSFPFSVLAVPSFRFLWLLCSEVSTEVSLLRIKELNRIEFLLG